MKHTNCLKYQLGIFTFLFSLLSFFSVHLLAQAPDGLINPGENTLVFANSIDLEIEAEAIELSVQLVSKGDNPELAKAQHIEAIDTLRNKMAAFSASVTSIAEEDIKISRPQFARLRFSKPQAESSFIVSVTTDYQLAEAAKILKKAKDIKIQGYELIYNETIGTDNELTTDLTNQILEDIRKQAKETGKPITPKGFSELNVETLEEGRERLERLLDGKKLKNWKQSDQKITLVRTNKKVSVALIAE